MTKQIKETPLPNFPPKIDLEFILKNLDKSLDLEFELMINNDFRLDQEKKDLYHDAILAFINEIAHYGLPKIRRERYTRELETRQRTRNALLKYGIDLDGNKITAEQIAAIRSR